MWRGTHGHGSCANRPCFVTRSGRPSLAALDVPAVACGQAVLVDGRGAAQVVAKRRDLSKVRRDLLAVGVRGSARACRIGKLREAASPNGAVTCSWWTLWNADELRQSRGSRRSTASRVQPEWRYLHRANRLKVVRKVVHSKVVHSKVMHRANRRSTLSTVRIAR
jgi:hypothetical protein